MNIATNSSVGTLERPTLTKRLVAGAMSIALAVSAYAGITASADTATVVTGTNFNTHSSADYKGVSVGFNVSNEGVVEPLTQVEVSLWADGEELVRNTGTEDLYDLYDGDTEFTSPFITFHSNPLYSNDMYWDFGEWSSMEAPTEARVTVNGETTVLSTTLTEPNGWTFESLLPEFYGENFNTHAGSDYQGVNVGFYVDGLEELNSVEVSLYDADDNLLVTNTGTEDLFELYADGTNKFSTPFITSLGDYDLEGDTYWNFGEWSAFTEPAYATVTVNGEMITLDNLTGPAFDELVFDNYASLSKEACKNGGWKMLMNGDDMAFRNQGQCVAATVSSENSRHNR